MKVLQKLAKKLKPTKKSKLNKYHKDHPLNKKKRGKAVLTTPNDDDHHF